MAKDWFAAKPFASMPEAYETDPGSVVVLQLNEAGREYPISLACLLFFPVRCCVAYFSWGSPVLAGPPNVRTTLLHSGGRHTRAKLPPPGGDPRMR